MTTFIIMITTIIDHPHDKNEQVTSPLVSQLRDQYSLAWTVQSFLRIEEARILYRRLMVSLL